MSLFRTLVDGISTVGNMVTSSISPYKVQLVKPETYDIKTAMQRSHCLVLYKIPGCYDCVFTHPTFAPKAFSLFRLVKEGESIALYKALSRLMTVLVESTSSLCAEEKIQTVCDCVRENPTWTPAHIAAFVGMFETFKNEIVKRDINTMSTVSGVTPLMAAVLGRQKHCVHEMLIHGAEVDRADMKGLTVYHYAVLNLPEVIDFLVDHDRHKTFDWLDGKGQSALYLACSQKPDKTADPLLQKHVAVEMLLAGGADPTITKTNLLPIHMAVSLGDQKCIEMILKKHDSQKNAQDKKHGGTPLHWAKTREVTELLCRLGCDVDAVGFTNHTPLQVMLMKDRKECLMELLCYGANCNIGDTSGDTPLHVAIQKDDVELVRSFIVFGANVNQRNIQGFSPRHVAAISKGKNKDVILNMLHVSGAKRCPPTTKGCLVGCSPEGGYNGKPDEKWKPLFDLDKIALFDDMLCSAVSCTSQLDSGRGEVLLDLADGPTDVGDRVLTLDGGGIRGLVLIQLLSAIEEAAGVPAQDLFDWMGGTSTGGILALGLAVGKSLPYMRGLYFRLKDQVFQGSRPYDSAPFESLLKTEFGESKVMTDIKHPKVIVTGVLADRFPPELHLFRSYTPSLDKPAEQKGNNAEFEPIKKPHEQLVWKAARSTGAAPTYFRTFAQYMDGGVMSNNPTLDVLTEIHEYNTGLKVRHESETIQPLGCVVSLGCGRPPVVPRDHIDVFKPSGIFDAHRVIKGTTALVSLLIDQATAAEGPSVDRARAWCSMINVPFYRFSPQLSEDLSLDCKDNNSLINMMWETQCYIVANRHRIEAVAQLLKGSKRGSQASGAMIKGPVMGLQEVKLHAP